MSKLAKILFSLLMTLLVFAMLQQNFKIVKTKKLHGSIKKIKQPELNLDNWFSEKYQKGTEKYIAQHFGFANWFIKIENQIQFTLFNKAKANGVIIGKEDYLFEKSYIDAYYGDDFLGEQRIRELYTKLSKVNDALKKLDKRLMIVFAPGKASFFAEYIPDKLKRKKKETNLEYCISMADSLGIDHIDMSSWFIKMKDTASYPLYPKTGIHWSYYGVKLAADTILSYCRNKLSLKLPEVKWSPIELSPNLKGPDDDIEKGMNLIFPLANHPMPYLKTKPGPQTKNTAKSIVVADSYYWQFYNMGFSKKVFREGQFWFYNKQVFPKRNKQDTWTKNLDLRKEIMDNDIIILFATEPVLKREYWGFVDQAYDSFFNTSDEYKEREQILEIIESIKSSHSWLEKIKDKAIKRNISLDSMLILDAKYVLYKKLIKSTVK